MTDKSRVLVLNGPNLNLLGSREPEIYGRSTLTEIEQTLAELAQQAGLALTCEQRNAEHQLIDAIHRAREQADFIIINAAAFTHTSIAIRDALQAVQLPFIEVHLSNVHARESFRRHSYLSDIAVGVICGLGPAGYYFALQHAASFLRSNS